MERVAIIGGGFSGALLAINLLRHDGPDAVLIERRAHAGRGTAYSTAHPEHLLNVRAANMSAFPDDPDHFVRWLEARSDFSGAHFVPRRLYGDYLEELLIAARWAAPNRLSIVSGEAVDLERDDLRMQIRLADGGCIEADHVVLAIGNLPPATPAELGALALAAPVYVDDPWSGDLAAGLGKNDQVLVLGTGLTMIDTVLTLVEAGFGGRIIALSRRGLVPHAHVGGMPPGKRRERPDVRPSSLVKQLRTRARTVPWRTAVDELRPYTADIWRAMSLEDRARFLRHLRPWWDIHRHRIAPNVADRLEALRTSGQLEVVAGKIMAVARADDGLQLTIRKRGGTGMQDYRIRRLINATGPQGSLAQAREPLLEALRARGALRPDPLGIGIDVDQDSRVIDAAGKTDAQLHLIGPMTRGAFWEMVAVPDIRRQCWSLARRLCNAHWVEGNGL